MSRFPRFLELPININTDQTDNEEFIEPENNEYDLSLKLPNYKLHLNSCGRGKGLAIYYKDKFEVTRDICQENLQMTILESEDLCVICIYRSDQDKSLCNQLAEVIPASTPCLVIGDINICSMAASNHEVFTMLKVMGFSLLVTEATHITGGHIDQAWLRRPLNENEVFNTQLYSPYYNARDHDCILFTL